MSGTLFIVGTPIGNLQDMSPRAIKTLNDVDFIAAEDTRVTKKLLSRFQIRKPITSFFEHNKSVKGSIICERIKNGENCALVSDAGMPAISDPGETLARECRESGITVNVIPGPSALTAALAVSGLPSNRFTFEGFLSINKKSRYEHLNEIKDEPRTMVFYEAPHKLSATLVDLYSALGEREIAVVREISKIYEETNVMQLSDAVEKYKNGIKGEIVLIVSGKERVDEKDSITLEQAVEISLRLIDSGTTISDAARESAKLTKFSKSEIYKGILEFKK